MSDRGPGTEQRREFRTTRRGALKLMGAAVGATAVASIIKPEPAFANGSEYLGGNLPFGCAVGSSGPGRVDVVATGNDWNIWQNFQQNGPWSGWIKIAGGSSYRAPGCTWRHDGTFWVFVQGTNGLLYGNLWNGSRWGGWAQILGSGYVKSGPSACSWGPGRLDIVVQGNDNAVWHGWNVSPNPAWGWESLGKDCVGGLNPAVMSWGPNRLDVFVIASDLNVWHKWYANGWSALENLSPGGTKGAAGIGCLGWNGYIDVFVNQGTGASGSGTINQLTYNGGWGGWGTLYDPNALNMGGLIGGTGKGGPAYGQGQPGAFSWGSPRKDIVLGSGGDHIWYP